jgi:hypothetical protein
MKLYKMKIGIRRKAPLMTKDEASGTACLGPEHGSGNESLKMSMP